MRDRVAWPDLAARLVALGWRREGRALRGPCPVTGAGRRGAWFKPGRTAAVVGGCHKCNESFAAHLAAVRGEPARHVAPQHATTARPAFSPFRPRRAAVAGRCGARRDTRRALPD